MTLRRCGRKPRNPKLIYKVCLQNHEYNITMYSECVESVIFRFAVFQAFFFLFEPVKPRSTRVNFLQQQTRIARRTGNHGRVERGYFDKKKKREQLKKHSPKKSSRLIDWGRVSNGYPPLDRKLVRFSL